MKRQALILSRYNSKFFGDQFKLSRSFSIGRSYSSWFNRFIFGCLNAGRWVRPWGSK